MHADAAVRNQRQVVCFDVAEQQGGSVAGRRFDMVDQEAEVQGGIHGFWGILLVRTDGMAVYSLFPCLSGAQGAFSLPSTGKIGPFFRE